jgi:transcription antitermination factor NusG
MVNSWTLLRLNPQNQSRYIDHVADNHPEVEIYFPVFQKTTRPHGRRHPVVVSRPVYPGYVFANIDMNGHGVRLLISTPIRARFIRFGPNISTIPDRVITELRRLEGLSLLVREVHRVNPYVPGVRVRVHTPIADIQAVIIALLNRSRVKVDSVLGNITVPIHQVTIL